MRQMIWLKNKRLFNILFWVLYFLYEWLGNAAVDNEYERYLINAAVIVPITFLQPCLRSITCSGHFI